VLEQGRGISRHKGGELTVVVVVRDLLGPPTAESRVLKMQKKVSFIAAFSSIGKE
jgi:hypothetical protein